MSYGGRFSCPGIGGPTFSVCNLFMKQETGRLRHSPSSTSPASCLYSASYPPPPPQRVAFSSKRPRWHTRGYDRHTKKWASSNSPLHPAVGPGCNQPPPPGAKRHHQPLAKLTSLFCPTCRLPVRMHLRGASMMLAHRLSASPKATSLLLRDWLTCTAGWLHFSNHPPHADDLSRLLIVLHLLHTEAQTLPDHQTSDTSPGPALPRDPIPLSLASKRLG